MNIDVQKINNNIIFDINKDLYDIKVIMKAAYKFIDKFYVSIDESEDKIAITLEAKKSDGNIDMNKYKGEFNNELLRQNIRCIVSEETKDIRKLIIGKSLYDTCLEYEENNNQVLQDNDLDVSDNLNILTNWFDNE